MSLNPFPSHPPQPTKLLYSDTVRAFNDDSFITNLNDACRNLAKSSVKLVQTFDTISNELNSVDIQVCKTTSPTLPRWSTIQRDYKDVIRQHRASAGLISGRLKMFYGLILPMVTRDIDRSPRSHNEKIHVLKSYMNISSDHAAFTHNLATTALKVTSDLNHFHTEFAKMSSKGKESGQMELRDLTHKLSHLESIVNQLCFTLGQSSLPDAALLAFMVLKMSAPGTRRSTRKTLTAEKVALRGNEEAAIGALYERLESAHSELVHAQYSVQVAHRNTDIVATTRTAISNLVSDEILNIQTGLGLFLTIWATLRTECMDVLEWLENQKKHPKPPPCVETYLTDGRTLYSSLAGALDAYIEGLEASHLTR